MCIPRVTPATGSFFVMNLVKLSINKTSTYSKLSIPGAGANVQRKLATMRCVPSNRSIKSDGQQAPMCPVLTYFTIVTVFMAMAIVAMNNLHGYGRPNNIGD